ncbi:hypothetical protein ABVK25_012440 [Lepraria finkii]|uniref:Uncharacterized protein n=1 Tax=Lepraria finkii TaxID=1340010 RepID=A0ABR4AE79_9LECA
MISKFFYLIAILQTAQSVIAASSAHEILAHDFVRRQTLATATGGPAPSSVLSRAVIASPNPSAVLPGSVPPNPESPSSAAPDAATPGPGTPCSVPSGSVAPGSAPPASWSGGVIVGGGPGVPSGSVAPGSAPPACLFGGVIVGGGLGRWAISFTAASPGATGGSWGRGSGSNPPFLQGPPGEGVRGQWTRIAILSAPSLGLPHLVEEVEVGSIFPVCPPLPGPPPGGGRRRRRSGGGPSPPPPPGPHAAGGGGGNRGNEPDNDPTNSPSQSPSSTATSSTGTDSSSASTTSFLSHHLVLVLVPVLWLSLQFDGATTNPDFPFAWGT